MVTLSRAELITSDFHCMKKEINMEWAQIQKWNKINPFLSFKYEKLSFKNDRDMTLVFLILLAANLIVCCIGFIINKFLVK